jgi:hypothetical protein
MDFRRMLALQTRVGWISVIGSVVFIVAAFGVAWYPWAPDDLFVASVVAGFLAASGFEELVLPWAAHLVGRRSRELEQHARSLGFTPSAADGRVYERMVEDDHVKLWVADGPRTVRADPLAHRIATRLLYRVWFVGGAWYGSVGLVSALAAAALWSAFRIRPTIEIEGADKTGECRRTYVRRLEDLEVALRALPTVPSAPRRFPLPTEVDVSHLLSRVRYMEDEDAVVEAVVMVGEVGSPSAVRPLIDSFLKRGQPMSPRIAQVVERAGERIRQRHGLAEQGALAHGLDDSAGRIGVERESGALSPTEENK